MGIIRARRKSETRVLLLEAGIRVFSERGGEPGQLHQLAHASSRPMGPRSTRLIAPSHTIEHGMVTYRALPAPVIGDWLSRDASSARYAPGTTFQIGKIGMLANTGTYIDAPFHRL